MSVIDPHKRKRPHTPNWASRTGHCDGEKIGRAVRAQQRAALLAYPAKTRSDAEWRALYKAAMQETRATRIKGGSR